MKFVSLSVFKDLLAKRDFDPTPSKIVYEGDLIRLGPISHNLGTARPSDYLRYPVVQIGSPVEALQSFLEEIHQSKGFDFVIDMGYLVRVACSEIRVRNAEPEDYEQFKVVDRCGELLQLMT